MEHKRRMKEDFMEKAFDEYDDARVWLEGFLRDPSYIVKYASIDYELRLGDVWNVTVRYSRNGNI